MRSLFIVYDIRLPIIMYVRLAATECELLIYTAPKKGTTVPCTPFELAEARF